MARFVEEAQVAAQLQHPAMVPVHDVGQRPDGRLWFTMKEIRGQTFTDVIAAHHRGEPGWTLHRLMELFNRV